MLLRVGLPALALGLSLLAAAAPGGAQIDPNDPLGLGTKLGVQSLNNSGQVGTVTLFRRGAGHALVDVSLSGVSPAKIELASIRRGHDCAGAITPQAAFVLNDVHKARSRTALAASEATLLSGNYIVVVASKQTPSHYLACGHLYR